MTDLTGDQAAGLRSLMPIQSNNAVQVVTVTGGKKGIGKTSVTVNLASALAEKGKRVLLIDENTFPNNICEALGLKGRFDLIHAIHQDKKLSEVVLQGADNIFVLPAFRGVHVLSQLDAATQGRLVQNFSQFSESIDVILIDTAMSGATHVLPFSLASDQVLIVLSGSAASLMGAYALIKIISTEYDKKHFLVFVNKTDSGQTARVVFDNFLRVVRKYLSVSLEFIGYAQADKKIYQASRLCQSVPKIFPASQTANSFRHLADHVLYSSCIEGFDGEADDFMQRLIHTSHLSMAHLTA